MGGKHAKDWEHVVLNFARSGNTYCLKSVTFAQHAGHYTRRLGKFQIENNRRVIVYVGKIAHGSYHAGCKFRFCCAWNVDTCVGGCGYWENMRNPSGNRYKFTSTHLLHMDTPVSSLRKKGGSRNYCNYKTCDGKRFRALTTSGCWQNAP